MKFKFLLSKYKKYFSDNIFNCYMNIKCGSGGIESQNFVAHLSKMYIKWAEYNSYKYNIRCKIVGNVNGYKLIVINFIGDYSYNLLCNENGIHRFVRRSPFNKNNKRHTSFVSVFVYPYAEGESINSFFINKNDVKIDFYRSSGNGGQHVNKTESAVRIHHLPTGIITTSSFSRSQHVNKKIALNQLKIKLINFLKNKNSKNKNICNGLSISWSNHIRSYMLDSSIVKDNRSNFTVNDVKSVLCGKKINDFIFSNIDHNYKLF